MRLTHAKRGLDNTGQNTEMGLAKALFPGKDSFEADGDRGRQPAPLGAPLTATGELSKVGFDIHNNRVRAVAYRCQAGDLRARLVATTYELLASGSVQPDEIQARIGAILGI